MGFILFFVLSFIKSYFCASTTYGPYTYTLNPGDYRNVHNSASSTKYEYKFTIYCRYEKWKYGPFKGRVELEKEKVVLKHNEHFIVLNPLASPNNTQLTLYYEKKESKTSTWWIWLIVGLVIAVIILGVIIFGGGGTTILGVIRGCLYCGNYKKKDKFSHIEHGANQVQPVGDYTMNTPVNNVNMNTQGGIVNPVGGMGGGYQPTAPTFNPGYNNTSSTSSVSSSSGGTTTTNIGFMGSSGVTRGNTTKFSDSSGRSAGRSEQRGNTTKFYDKSGRSTGRSEQRGNTTKFYDKSGRSNGRSEKRGNTTKFYDKSGRSKGRSETRGNTTKFYDKSGRSAGRMEKRGNKVVYYDKSGRRSNKPPI